MSDEVVVMSDAGLTQEIRSGSYEWIADEPLAVGGGGLGPSPYELLLSSLGACTSMTLRLYSMRKGWDVKRIVVRLRHYRVHAGDCIDCENKRAFMDRIERHIEISGDLTPEQKARLQVIAESCPVHRTLTSSAAIFTKLV